MSGGYMGKLLIVDLSTGEMKEEPLDENICRQRAELEGTSRIIGNPPQIVGPLAGVTADINAQVHRGMVILTGTVSPVNRVKQSYWLWRHGRCCRDL